MVNPPLNAKLPLSSNPLSPLTPTVLGENLTESTSFHKVKCFIPPWTQTSSNVHEAIPSVQRNDLKTKLNKACVES